MVSVDTISANPSWLPHAYLATEDAFVFAHLPRDFQRNAIFLDDRYLASAERSAPIPAAQLRAAVPRDGVFAHFIFHTAFCCSTLLARALDVPGAAMGVKEPTVLVSFSTLAATRRESAASRNAFGLALDLLARPLGANERQIIKASNVNNLLIPDALEYNNQSKAIFLHGSLEGFVRSIAKKGLFGRAFARRLYAHFSPLLALPTGLTSADVFELTDLQIAALVWLMQANQLSSLAARYGARVRLLDSEHILAEPLETMQRVGRFFDLNVEQDVWRAVVDGPIFASDAKNHNQPFDAQKRRDQHHSVDASYGEELQIALKWAYAVADHARAPKTLGDTLSG